MKIAILKTPTLWTMVRVVQRVMNDVVSIVSGSVLVNQESSLRTENTSSTYLIKTQKKAAETEAAETEAETAAGAVVVMTGR